MLDGAFAGIASTVLAVMAAAPEPAPVLELSTRASDPDGAPSGRLALPPTDLCTPSRGAPKLIPCDGPLQHLGGPGPSPHDGDRIELRFSVAPAQASYAYARSRTEQGRLTVLTRRRPLPRSTEYAFTWAPPGRANTLLVTARFDRRVRVFKEIPGASEKTPPLEDVRARWAVPMIPQEYE